MRADALHPIAFVLAELLPETWKHGETSFDMLIPLARRSDKNIKEIPFVSIKLTKKHFDYIKANTP